MIYDLLISAVFVSFVVGSGDAKSLRIIGGTEAPVYFGRYHVSLQNLSGHHVCGGAIISKYHITTAAHCVIGASPQYIKAVVGTTNLDEGGIEFDVHSINIHPDYNVTLRTNDIAIIKILGEFGLNDVDILGLEENELSEGDEVVLTGFGADEPRGESLRQMHLLNLTVFSQETCKFAMRYTREVFDSMFCTFTRIGEGTCNGDSGGPLVKDNQLVGLVSWGIPCGVGFPDVHTRITPFIEWIRREIK